jgi:hypothetical protein
MPQSVYTEGIKILVGEVQLKSAFEIPDAPLYLDLAQRAYRNRYFF